MPAFDPLDEQDDVTDINQEPEIPSMADQVAAQPAAIQRMTVAEHNYINGYISRFYGPGAGLHTIAEMALDARTTGALPAIAKQITIYQARRADPDRKRRVTLEQIGSWDLEKLNAEFDASIGSDGPAEPTPTNGQSGVPEQHSPSDTTSSSGTVSTASTTSSSGSSPSS